ncbi:MAG: MBL fold metallo-hydrolase [Pseudomonadales bacterium]|nr:MBL fold metallo-hydrolase [Pseudomonadales bacterium]
MTEYSSEDFIDRDIGPVRILFGYDNGKYPHGNSFLIRGGEQTAIVDPCLGVVERKKLGREYEADLVLQSHVHEDHMSGAYLYKDVPWYAHELDAPGLTSMDAMMDIYGLSEPARSQFEKAIVKEFNYVTGDDVRTFEDGSVFDFGGVRMEVMHTPGHTRGHRCFLIEWDGSDDRFVYLGDVELTGFGPYYGDAWSDLEDFERTLEKLRNVDARWWLTFHHKGLIEGRETFLEMLDSFAAMIDSRESRLLEFIDTPRTLDEIVAHRFVFRPGAEGFFVEHAERRSMQMHLDRLMRDGEVVQTGEKFKRADP